MEDRETADRMIEKREKKIKKGTIKIKIMKCQMDRKTNNIMRKEEQTDKWQDVWKIEKLGQKDWKKREEDKERNVKERGLYFKGMRVEMIFKTK